MLRSPAAVVGALCVSAALIGAPAAVAQPLAPGPGVSVDNLPELSELPPLPPTGDPAGEDDDSESGIGGMSGVQTAALVLAGSVLVAGGVGLAVVTRRGRGDVGDPRTGRAADREYPDDLDDPDRAEPTSRRAGSRDG